MMGYIASQMSDVSSSEMQCSSFSTGNTVFMKMNV